MIIELEGVTFDIYFTVHDGDPPSDDGLYPGTPDTYELYSLYITDNGWKSFTRCDELWYMLDLRIVETIIEIYKERNG